MITSSSGTLRLPPTIHFGYGSRAQLGPTLRGLGSRVLVIADPFLPGSEVFAEILRSVDEADITVLVTTEVEPELPVPSLDALARVGADFAPDAILAIGGGSVLDAAKLVALLLTYGGPLSRYYGESAVPGPTTPLVAMPTTAGTGSEVTSVAVVSDPDRRLKVGVSSPHLVPTAAIVDPELTLGAPRSVSAHSGIDALVHAIESFTATPLEPAWGAPLPVFVGRNVFSDTIALHAAELLVTSLPAVHRDPGDRSARESAALGSLLAGVSFGQAGTHLSHALQYPLGAITKTPHGLGTGLLLPYVLEAIIEDPGALERVAAIGARLGSPSDTDRDRAHDAIETIARLGGTIGLPHSLAELGVERSRLPEIAELAMGSARLIAISPVPADTELLLGILERAHSGALAEERTP